MIKIISLIIVLAFIVGCSSTSIKHLNQQEFIMKAKNLEIEHSIHTYKFIGQTKKRIYLEHWNGITNKTTIYWTEKVLNVSPIFLSKEILLPIKRK